MNNGVSDNNYNNGVNTNNAVNDPNVFNGVQSNVNTNVNLQQNIPVNTINVQPNVNQVQYSQQPNTVSQQANGVYGVGVTQPSVNIDVQPNVGVQPVISSQNPTVTSKPSDVKPNPDVNYKPPGKFKIFLLIVFFILLIAFVLFLPEITEYINVMKSGGLNYEKEEITTGKLICTISSSTTNLDKDYELKFSYTDKKLQKVQFFITTKGDVSLDEETLDELANNCKLLKENVKDIDGVSIRCDYTDGKLEETQNYDLTILNEEDLDAAFVEAGGNKPEYKKDQDIDKLERNLIASGYTCEREK